MLMEVGIHSSNNKKRLSVCWFWPIPETAGLILTNSHCQIAALTRFNLTTVVYRSIPRGQQLVENKD